MGIDAGHHRNDVQLAVGIANFANEMSSLYVSTGAGPATLFTDEAAGEGIGAPSRAFLSFGATAARITRPHNHPGRSVTLV